MLAARPDRGWIAARAAAATLAVAASLAVVPGAGACRKGPKDLAFGVSCSSDGECSSGFCLFASEAASKDAAAKGRCTRRCTLGRDDCPEGTACASIAIHGGREVPVCGEPPPFPLGPSTTPGPPGAGGAPGSDGGSHD